MKFSIFILIVCFVVSAFAEDNKQLKKIKLLNEIIDYKIKIDKLHSELIENDMNEAKNAKFFLHCLSILFTRIEYNYENQYFIYDLKMNLLKIYADRFIKIKKIPKEFDLKILKLGKNDEIEYELIVQQVIINRILKYLKDKKSGDSISNINRLGKYKGELQEAEYIKILIDTTLIENREWMEVNDCNMDYVRRKGAKFIRLYDGKVDIKEMDEFESSKDESIIRADDELRPETAILQELITMTNKELRIAMKFVKEGNRKKVDESDKHRAEIRNKIENLIGEIRNLTDPYFRSVNEASKLFN